MATFFFFILTAFFSLTSPRTIHAEPIEDKQALLDFINPFPHSRKINWNQSTPVCTSWTGITCNGDHTRVIALRLPGIGFSGEIPANTINRLSALQTLSLRSNSISGPFPFDLLKLQNLSGVYLQSNRFSGQLPKNFPKLKNLLVLNLSNNQFNGSIPSSLSNLTHLISLDLSDNNLTGIVPKSLQKFPISSFSGNNVSFEESSPLIPVTAPPVHRKLSESAILWIVLGGCFLVFVVFALYMLVCCSRKESSSSSAQKFAKKRVTESHERRDGQDGKITFFEGCSLAFDLEDLLRASAEVLGKGAFGTTYKAALEDSTTVAVKRLKEVGVGRREFEQQMDAVGRIAHENVVALRAYYYSKEEKLMVYDYFILGSISTLLHGKRGEDRIPLDWDTRLRIAVGGARGVAHIHAQNGGRSVHGNIKASNIFLNSRQYGCVSDLGLATIVSPIAPPVSRSAGYRAPEVTDPRRATQASDVYSFGVFVLELLTGKSPVGEGVNLVKWVNSVVREEWTAEVFDVELLKYPNVEEEMVQMLQIGLVCTARAPDQRPRMADVARMAEEIRRARSEGSTPSSTPLVADIASTSGVTSQ